jgi:hypothetical protein
MRAGPGSAIALVAVSLGIVSVVCVVVAGQLTDSRPAVALGATVAAFLLGVGAFVCGVVAHGRIARAGWGRLREAVAGWACGLAGILIGPYLGYAIVLGVAFKNLRGP